MTGIINTKTYTKYESFIMYKCNHYTTLIGIILAEIRQYTISNVLRSSVQVFANVKRINTINPLFRKANIIGKIGNTLRLQKAMSSIDISAKWRPMQKTKIENIKDTTHAHVHTLRRQPSRHQPLSRELSFLSCSPPGSLSYHETRHIPF